MKRQETEQTTVDSPEYAWAAKCDFRNKTVYGPRGITAEQIEQLDKGEGTAWKTKCSDGETMDRGRLLGDWTGFEPLDDFSGPDKGAVDIYLYEKNEETGRWSWDIV